MTFARSLARDALRELCSSHPSKFGVAQSATPPWTKKKGMENEKYAILVMELKMLQDENIQFIESQTMKLRAQGHIVESYVFSDEMEKLFTRLDLLKHGYTVLEIY